MSIISTRHYSTWYDANDCLGEKQPELTNSTEEDSDHEEQH